MMDIMPRRWEDGENPITVEVTSPDKKVKKIYTVNIYRNEEDKQKNLKPLEAEDIDFENSDDVIRVMIEEYPRVSASVFNELKNYPNKIIIFQGNDYSLEFKGLRAEKGDPAAGNLRLPDAFQLARMRTSSMTISGITPGTMTSKTAL